MATLDLNRATAEELATLPGVGEIIAERIIQRRKYIGLYRSVQQLREVLGIGETRLAGIRPLVHVSTDGATASGRSQAPEPARPGRHGS